MRRRTRLLSLAAALAALLPSAAGAAHAGAAAQGAPIVVSYAALLDPAVIVRTGETLKQAAARAARRALLQPFLDRYSSLLPYAVELLYGKDRDPQEDAAARYPPGTPQPAWAAILRGGRIHLTADGRGGARAFVPGVEPRAAYRAQYSVLRHPLAALLPPGGGGLTVEVFSYENDYPSQELRLNPKPYRFRAKAFPPEGLPPDLAELGRFLNQAGPIEGAELDRRAGLVLYASGGEKMTVGGAPPSLADLAVAYRAVFHAGDNEAFVSLDPHTDLMRSSVNFGGFLEDTGLGAVALAADRRLKTVANGLDPGTFEDVRARVRESLPTFATNTERLFLERPSAAASWIVTRYWFYPGSCGVEVDPQRRFAAVTRPWFSADAERMGVEYVAGDSQTKQLLLPQEVRENVKHLNGHYADYAALFPELRELTVLARLMAIFSWLLRERPAWLDLDALLGVELPAVTTPRDLTRIFTGEYLPLPMAGAPDAEYVARRTRVLYLNPDFDTPVEAAFGSPEGLAQFLRFRPTGAPQLQPDLAEQSRRLFESARTQPVRALVRTEEDLQGLLRALTVLRASREEGQDALQAEAMYIRGIQSQLAGLQSASTGAGQGLPPETAAEKTRLEKELQERMRALHDRWRAAGGRRLYNVRYVGGITMSPHLFRIEEKSASPRIEQLRKASRSKSRSGVVRSHPVEASSPEPPRPATPAEEEVPLPQAAAPGAPRGQAIEGRDPASGKGVIGRIGPDGRILFTPEKK